MKISKSLVLGIVLVMAFYGVARNTFAQSGIVEKINLPYSNATMPEGRASRLSLPNGAPVVQAFYQAIPDGPLMEVKQTSHLDRGVLEVLTSRETPVTGKDANEVAMIYCEFERFSPDALATQHQYGKLIESHFLRLEMSQARGLRIASISGNENPNSPEVNRLFESCHELFQGVWKKAPARVGKFPPNVDGITSR